MRWFAAGFVILFASPVGVVVLAALDSTLFFSLPFGIDAAVIILAARLQTLWWVVPILATVGSVAGAWLTFWMGVKAGEQGLDRYVSDEAAGPRPRQDPAKRRRGARRAGPHSAAVSVHAVRAGGRRAGRERVDLLRHARRLPAAALRARSGARRRLRSVTSCRGWSPISFTISCSAASWWPWSSRSSR